MGTTREERVSQMGRLEAIVALLRRNPHFGDLDCNLLENGINWLVGVAREGQGWTSADLPSVCTLGASAGPTGAVGPEAGWCGPGGPCCGRTDEYNGFGSDGPLRSSSGGKHDDDEDGLRGVHRHPPGVARVRPALQGVRQPAVPPRPVGAGAAPVRGRGLPLRGVRGEAGEGRLTRRRPQGERMIGSYRNAHGSVTFRA